MPLKINNLKVSISVNQAKSEGGEGSSKRDTDLNSGNKGNPEKLTQDIIEQVFRIMSDKNER